MIIWPTLAARRGARNPGPRAWRAAIDAHLRGAYLVARAAGLAFAARGGGRLLVVIDAPPADELIANVVAEGLICLADGLRKALGAAVDVASLQLAPGRGDRHAAAHVRAWLAAPPGVFNVTVGAPSRSRSPAASARRG
ncbi:MAG: hypothetical protein SF182_29725 [Deltaproteobacteria bacterium]|nr:hypothetical protein [Deltaproteobacteria bacterium]